MSIEILLFLFLGFWSLIFILISIIFKKYFTRQLAITTATVINTKYLDARFSSDKSYRNTKLAQFQYFVEGQCYTSTNWVVITTETNIGDKVQIQYFIRQPEKIYNKLGVRMAFIFVFAIPIIVMIVIFAHQYG